MVGGCLDSKIRGPKVLVNYANSILGIIMRLSVVLSALVAIAGCTATSTLNASPFAPPTERYAAIVVDTKSGKVLHETRADAIRFPASLTKMMTIYMMFDAMKRGKINRDTLIPISQKAAAEPASKLYFKPGDTVSVDLALRALVVKSANDVAYAVAEFLNGSEAAFAARMTFKARTLGLKSTVFRNASGLPDKDQITTARDMAKLSMALRRDFPQYYGYFRLSSFTFRGKTIRGHNRVLGRVEGADGIKTGYTRASGFNLASSVRQGGRSVVAVILGENTGKIRDQHMTELLNFYLPKSSKR